MTSMVNSLKIKRKYNASPEATSGLFPVPFRVFLYDLGARFHELAINGILKDIRKIALNIQFRDKLTASEDRDHDFRFHHRGAWDVAGVVHNIIDYDGLSFGGGRPTKPLPKG